MEVGLDDSSTDSSPIEMKQIVKNNSQQKYSENDLRKVDVVKQNDKDKDCKIHINFVDRNKCEFMSSNSSSDDDNTIQLRDYSNERSSQLTYNDGHKTQQGYHLETSDAEFSSSNDAEKKMTPVFDLGLGNAAGFVAQNLGTVAFDCELLKRMLISNASEKADVQLYDRIRLLFINYKEMSVDVVATLFFKIFSCIQKRHIVDFLSDFRRHIRTLCLTKEEYYELLELKKNIGLQAFIVMRNTEAGELLVENEGGSAMLHRMLLFAFDSAIKKWHESGCPSIFDYMWTCKVNHTSCHTWLCFLLCIGSQILTEQNLAAGAENCLELVLKAEFFHTGMFDIVEANVENLTQIYTHFVNSSVYVQIDLEALKGFKTKEVRMTETIKRKKNKCLKNERGTKSNSKSSESDDYYRAESSSEKDEDEVALKINKNREQDDEESDELDRDVKKDAKTCNIKCTDSFSGHQSTSKDELDKDSSSDNNLTDSSLSSCLSQNSLFRDVINAAVTEEDITDTDSDEDLVYDLFGSNVSSDTDIKTKAKNDKKSLISRVKNVFDSVDKKGKGYTTTITTIRKLIVNDLSFRETFRKLLHHLTSAVVALREQCGNNVTEFFKGLRSLKFACPKTKKIISFWEKYKICNNAYMKLLNKHCKFYNVTPPIEYASKTSNFWKQLSLSDVKNIRVSNYQENFACKTEDGNDSDETQNEEKMSISTNVTKYTGVTPPHVIRAVLLADENPDEWFIRKNIQIQKNTVTKLPTKKSNARPSKPKPTKNSRGGKKKRNFTNVILKSQNDQRSEKKACERHRLVEGPIVDIEMKTTLKKKVENDEWVLMNHKTINDWCKSHAKTELWKTVLCAPNTQEQVTGRCIFLPRQVWEEEIRGRYGLKSEKILCRSSNDVTNTLKRLVTGFDKENWTGICNNTTEVFKHIVNVKNFTTCFSNRDNSFFIHPRRAKDDTKTTVSPEDGKLEYVHDGWLCFVSGKKNQRVRLVSSIQNLIDILSSIGGTTRWSKISGNPMDEKVFRKHKVSDTLMPDVGTVESDSDEEIPTMTPIMMEQHRKQLKEGSYVGADNAINMLIPAVETVIQFPKLKIPKEKPIPVPKDEVIKKKRRKKEFDAEKRWHKGAVEDQRLNILRANTDLAVTGISQATRQMFEKGLGIYLNWNYVASKNETKKSQTYGLSDKKYMKSDYHTSPQNYWTNSQECCLLVENQGEKHCINGGCIQSSCIWYIFTETRREIQTINLQFLEQQRDNLKQFYELENNLGDNVLRRGTSTRLVVWGTFDFTKLRPSHTKHLTNIEISAILEHHVCPQIKNVCSMLTKPGPWNYVIQFEDGCTANIATGSVNFSFELDKVLGKKEKEEKECFESTNDSSVTGDGIKMVSQKRTHEFDDLVEGVPDVKRKYISQMSVDLQDSMEFPEMVSGSLSEESTGDDSEEFDEADKSVKMLLITSKPSVIKNKLKVYFPKHDINVLSVGPSFLDCHVFKKMLLFFVTTRQRLFNKTRPSALTHVPNLVSRDTALYSSPNDDAVLMTLLSRMRNREQDSPVYVYLQVLSLWILMSLDVVQKACPLTCIREYLGVIGIEEAMEKHFTEKKNNPIDNVYFAHQTDCRIKASQYVEEYFKADWVCNELGEGNRMCKSWMFNTYLMINGKLRTEFHRVSPGNFERETAISFLNSICKSVTQPTTRKKSKYLPASSYKSALLIKNATDVYVFEKFIIEASGENAKESWILGRTVLLAAIKLS